MTFQEKFTWVSLVVFALVPGAYFMRMIGDAGGVPVETVAYQTPMLIAIGVSVALTIVGAIVMGIGSAIAQQISGEGSVDSVGREDERDKDINRRGELVGYYVASAGAVGALALAMLRQDQFWIANALYLSFVVASVVSAVVKLVAYRRGF